MQRRDGSRAAVLAAGHAGKLMQRYRATPRRIRDAAIPDAVGFSKTINEALRRDRYNVGQSTGGGSNRVGHHLLQRAKSSCSERPMRYRRALRYLSARKTGTYPATKNIPRRFFFAERCTIATQATRKRPDWQLVLPREVESFAEWHSRPCHLPDVGRSGIHDRY